MEKNEYTKKEKLLQEKVRSLFRKDKNDNLGVTISVGMIVSDGATSEGKFDIDEFLFNADKKMYEAKRKHHSEHKS